MVTNCDNELIKLSLTIMRAPKEPLVVFTGKYKILQLHPNGHSFFPAKCKILEIAPERPFGFLQ